MRLEDLALLLQLAQEYAASVGDVALDLTIRLKGGSQIAHPVPPVSVLIRQPPKRENTPAPEARSAPTPIRTHSPDFRSVSWDGEQYAFSTSQARVVELLWAATEAGAPCVSQAALLEGADSAADRLRDLFREHPAWGVLVVPGGKGVFRLAE